MIEKGNRILRAWRDFSKDPAFATRVMIDVAGTKVLKSFNPEYKRYERDLEELKKTHPDVHNLAMGTAVLFAVAFSVLCVVAYLIAV